MRELAKEAGVSVSAISLIENGERDPMFSTLLRICKGLNVSPIYLIDLSIRMKEALPTVERDYAAIKNLKDDISKTSAALCDAVIKIVP